MRTDKEYDELVIENVRLIETIKKLNALVGIAYGESFGKQLERVLEETKGQGPDCECEECVSEKLRSN